MRLFTYYAFHSVINQLKKIFKTWVFVFIAVCVVFGGLIGVGAGVIADYATRDAETEYVDELEDIEAVDETEDEIEFSIDDFLPGESNVSTRDIIELVIGAITLVIFIIMLIGADKSANAIFLPADVNLLFPSPMQPQSVLMFRLMTKLGALVFASAYMVFQLPNLIVNLGLSIWAAIGLIVAWCLVIVGGQLLQIFLYTFASTNSFVKANMRRLVYALILIIAGAYFAFWKSSGLSQMEASVRFFNSRISNYIPVWGWIKGFCMSIIDGNALAAGAYFAVILVTSLLFIYVIWNIKADFYEEAMLKSEEIAQMLDKANSEKSNGLVLAKKKKDRSDKLMRDGLSRGSGANVFFYKSMYNRRRFAHFGIFTKTTETYLVVAVGLILLCKLVLKVNPMLPTVLSLAGVAFYRTLGNPLAQDVETDYFRLIPESAWAKLFWSLIGGTVNCMLDVLPAVLITVIAAGVNPLVGLAWLLFIVSIDFYATNVGAFIDLSVPVSAGKLIKQLVQIMFIYFGLLPDIGIIAVGFVTGHIAIAVIIAGIVNVLLGLIFFIFSPLFIGGTFKYR